MHVHTTPNSAILMFPGTETPFHAVKNCACHDTETYAMSDETCTGF